MSPTRLAALALAAALAVGGCSTIQRGGPPEPTPLDFPGIAGELARQGVTISDWTSGDAGCDIDGLAPTAIRFTAAGDGVTAPVLLRIYIFHDREAYERRHADVEACVANWATEPATFELVDTSPYVLAGQGPWPAAFKSAVQAAITRAAGNGG